MNFVYTWVPQAVILIVMFLIKARPAAIAGAALALAGYLAFFNWWVITYHATDGLVWLLYLFSLPGGLLAGIAAAMWINKHDERPAIKAGLAAANLMLAGVAINQVSVHLALSS